MREISIASLEFDTNSLPMYLIFIYISAQSWFELIKDVILTHTYNSNKNAKEKENKSIA